MGKLCVPWLVRVLGLLQQQGVNIPQWDQKFFPFRNLLEAYFTESFPYGNPFGFYEAWRVSYFLIYPIHGWQANIDQYRQLVMTLWLSPHRPHKGVSLMKASALGCPTRLPVTLFPTRNIIQTDGHERCRQPVSSPSSHVTNVKHQPTHGYVIYLFFFHISCPLLHNFVDFNLTNLWNLLNYFFGSGEMGKSSINSSYRDVFNA